MSYSEEHEAYIREHGNILPDEDYEMNLGVRARRKLYTLSHGKCSICKTDLFLKEHNTDIAAECHISSHKKNYPSKTFFRYNPNLTLKERDKSYDNAILLCRNCHEIIDNPENTQYTIEELHRIKKKHEEEVAKDPEVIKESGERHKQLHEWIHEHNQKLIDTVIKPWYEDNFVGVEYEPFTTEHLQTGYAYILKQRQECKNLKNELLSEENAIKEYIKNKLAPQVPQFGFSIKEGFTVENIEMQIYKIIDNSVRKGQSLDNYTANLSLFGYRVEDNNEEYIKEKKEIFRKCIEEIIKDKTLYERFKKANKTRKLSYKKLDEFYQGMKQIEHDFEEKHVELKGTCKVCKDWHEELQDEKHDKERIYNWLYNETKRFGYSLLGEPNNPRWVSTIDIARHNHLPVDRVKEICIKHEGIVLMGKEDLWPGETLGEKWAIREFVKND